VSTILFDFLLGVVLEHTDLNIMSNRKFIGRKLADFRDNHIFRGDADLKDKSLP